MSYSKSTARVIYYLETEQVLSIQKLSKETGETMSATVRRLLARGLDAMVDEPVRQVCEL